MSMATQAPWYAGPPDELVEELVEAPEPARRLACALLRLRLEAWLRVEAGHDADQDADQTTIERHISELLDSQGQANWWTGVSDEAGYSVELLWNGQLIEAVALASNQRREHTEAYRIWRITWDQRPARLRLRWRSIVNDDGVLTSVLRPQQDLALAIHASAGADYW
jgi:hypothetical protein